MSPTTKPLQPAGGGGEGYTLPYRRGCCTRYHMKRRTRVSNPLFSPLSPKNTRPQTAITSSFAFRRNLRGEYCCKCVSNVGIPLWCCRQIRGNTLRRMRVEAGELWRRVYPPVSAVGCLLRPATPEVHARSGVRTSGRTNPTAAVGSRCRWVVNAGWLRRDRDVHMHGDNQALSNIVDLAGCTGNQAPGNPWAHHRVEGLHPSEYSPVSGGSAT